jgi:hypothetical protein
MFHGLAEADDIRLCVLEPGPGLYLSLLMAANSMTCADFATLAGLPPPLYDDAAFFTLDPATCSWSHTPDAGLSVVPGKGWSDPPVTSATATASAYSWELDQTTGDAWFAGDLTVAGHTGLGGAPISAQRVVNIAKTWTNPESVGGIAPAVLAFEGAGTCDALETCGAVGIQGSVGLGGAGDWEYGYGIAATAA